MTKKMTRTALITLAAVLVLAAVCVALVCTGTASAEVLNEGQQSSTVTVTYSVSGAWQVTITEEMSTFQSTKSGKITVQVDKAVLPHGQSLSVEVTSENDYKLVNNDDSLAYTVTPSGKAALSSSNKTILEGINGSTADLANAGKAELTVQLTGDPEEAKYDGNYTDTLTFTVTGIN